MAKLIEYFQAFLKDEVNLNPSRLNLLNQRVEAVTTYLQGSEPFKEHFLDTIPQGSYAHKTIIRPVHENDGFDVDILLHLNEIPGWEPANYVESLYACFRDSGTYKNMVSRKTRCVKVNYAGDFHIDVVPYLERNGFKYVTNRHTSRFLRTDPEKYNAWLDEKNRITGGHLVKVIRLVKFLRDYKNTFAVKSIILSILLGERVSAGALVYDKNCYADVPTTLRTVMNALADYVRARPTLPDIMDPGMTGDNFADRWDEDGYASFRDSIMLYAGWIDEAWQAAPKDSLGKWQRVFGDDFQAPKKELAQSALVVASSHLPVKYQNTEQHIRDLNIPMNRHPQVQFRISGYVLRDRSMNAYYLHDRGNKVLRGRRIRFEVVECNVIQPYQLFWKVLNRGQEAEVRDSIRGQIEEGGRTWRITETTDFSGSHYVECYVVKNGVCVGYDRQDVIIL